MSTSFGWEGKGRYGSFRCGWTRGVQVKLWNPLRTRAIPERLRGVTTTMRYTNLRLPLPLPFFSVWLSVCSCVFICLLILCCSLTYRFSHYYSACVYSWPAWWTFALLVACLCEIHLFVILLCIRSGRQLWGTGARAPPRHPAISFLVYFGVNLTADRFKICVVCEISQCQQLTALSISTALVTKLLVLEQLQLPALKFAVSAQWHNL